MPAMCSRSAMSAAAASAGTAGGAYATPGQTGYGGMVIDVGVLSPMRPAAAKNGANQFAEVGDLGHAATSAMEGISEQADTYAAVEAMASGD